MEPLLEVTRGGIVESLHRGAIAVVTPRGQVVAAVGDVEVVSFTRSAAKPLQALPFVASGGVDRIGLAEAEIALMTGSHGGETIHTEAAASILARVGLDERALQCGAHPPLDDVARRALGDTAPTQLHNNCSGKHSGMLAAAVDGGHPVDTYLAPDNPIQIAILRTIARFSGVPESEIGIGTDGCSAPNFALPVRAQALMIARLVNPIGFGEAEAAAARRIAAAMSAHPEMVAATRKRLDTDLMRAANGALVAKVGAEGVELIGIRPDERYPEGLGVALKIEDGDPAGRARDRIVAEIVRQLVGLTLDAYATTDNVNHRGIVVGQLRPTFRLSPTLAE